MQLTCLLQMILSNAKELFCHSSSAYFQKYYAFDNKTQRKIHNNKNRQQFTAKHCKSMKATSHCCKMP